MRRGLLLLLLLAPLATADPVPALYRKVAVAEGVPPSVFFALVRAESQRRSGAGDLPWPWTVNHRGQPYFFDTRSEAETFARGLIGEGDYRFDAGLAQVNWYWHHQRFLDDVRWAFEPVANLRVAARILREQYNRPACNTWALAVGCYHRPAQSAEDRAIASRYSQRVLQLWALDN